MSRRLPSSQRRPQHSDNNPYQGTTLPISSRAFVPNTKHLNQHDYKQKHREPTHRNDIIKPATAIDRGLSDETSDTQTYDFYYHGNGFQHSPLRESRNTDVTFSDDSGSTRLPYYEFDDESTKRYSRNTYSERSSRRPRRSPEAKSNSHTNNKDLRRVYPNQEGPWEQLYQEIQTPCNVPVQSVPRRIPTRLSDRPQSSLSSGVTSAVVHGCGGKCRTFENICYFFLQLVFTMGILIGVSLCIAGVVLRKSAARNLQVLVYIGVMLALVSGLLLAVQCEARNSARKRKKALMMAKRAPIQMDTLHLRTNPLHQQPLLVNAGNQRIRAQQIARVHGTLRPLPLRPQPPEDEQGIPWWRRTQANTNAHR